LAVTTNREPNEVQMTNQFDMGTSAADAPAAARTTKPQAMVTRSSTTRCFR
jgi:hypothetical protein